MDDRSVSVLEMQLETLTRLTALMLVKDCETLFEKVELLYCARMPPKIIADILQTTPNTVSVQISRMRAATRKKRSPRSSTLPSDLDSDVP